MKILVADDDSISRKVHAALLESWDYEPISVRDGASAWKVLESDDPPQLVLLDWIMPGMDGMEIVKRLREQQQSQYTYVIMLTSRNLKQDIEDALYAGCDDYLVKPFAPAELKARLFVGKRILKLHGDLTDAYNKAAFESEHDPLTGLLNRAAISRALDREMARHTRSGSTFSILVADIDHFKQVNDGHGHTFGDEVLKRISATLANFVRPYDLVGRYGGEEFLIVVPDCDLKEAKDVADRICEAVRGLSDFAEQSFRVSLSVGVAQVCHHDGNAENLIKRADRSLYCAKNAGRDRVEASCCGDSLFQSSASWQPDF